MRSFGRSRSVIGWCRMCAPGFSTDPYRTTLGSSRQLTLMTFQVILLPKCNLGPVSSRTKMPSLWPCIVGYLVPPRAYLPVFRPPVPPMASFSSLQVFRVLVIQSSRGLIFSPSGPQNVEYPVSHEASFSSPQTFSVWDLVPPVVSLSKLKPPMLGIQRILWSHSRLWASSVESSMFPVGHFSVLR